MRWHYRDPLLMWLFVVAYAAHLAEEWFAGFPEWLALVAGRPLSRGAFLTINAVAFVVMVAAVRAATNHERWGWMAIAVATVVTINGLAHLAGSIAAGVYSPGLITGVVLYLPLGQLALLRAREQTTRAMFWRGLGAALVAHALVTVAAILAA